MVSFFKSLKEEPKRSEKAEKLEKAEKIEKSEKAEKTERSNSTDGISKDSSKTSLKASEIVKKSESGQVASETPKSKKELQPRMDTPYPKVDGTSSKKATQVEESPANATQKTKTRSKNK